MKKLLIICALSLQALSFSASAITVENETMLNAIVVSKFSGVCITLLEMVKFQESTNINGDKEFVNRFIAKTSTSFGVSSGTLGKKCKEARVKYRAAYKLLSGSNKELLKF